MWRETPAAGDVAAVAALVAGAGAFSAEEVRVAAELVETTLSGRETYRFVFADGPDGLLGYTCFDRIPLSAVSYDLYWIVVAPDLRGTGLAQELLDRTAALARADGGLQMFADTSSGPQYEAARAFYRKAGFAEAARFADFYALGDDKLVFRLGL